MGYYFLYNRHAQERQVFSTCSWFRPINRTISTGPRRPNIPLSHPSPLSSFSSVWCERATPVGMTRRKYKLEKKLVKNRVLQRLLQRLLRSFSNENAIPYCTALVSYFRIVPLFVGIHIFASVSLLPVRCPVSLPGKFLQLAFLLANYDVRSVHRQMNEISTHDSKSS